MNLKALKDRHAALLAQRHELAQQQQRARKQAQAGDGHAISALARLRAEICEIDEAIAEFAPLIAAAEREAAAESARQARLRLLAQAETAAAKLPEAAARLDAGVRALIAELRALEEGIVQVRETLRQAGAEGQMLANVSTANLREDFGEFCRLLADGRMFERDIAPYGMTAKVETRVRAAAHVISTLRDTLADVDAAPAPAA